MHGLGELLTQPSTAPAVVLGAVVHAELATVAPFGEASGLVARAAEHLVLISAGLDPLCVIVVEAGHLAAAEQYHAGLARYSDGGVAGVAGWIIQCAAAVSRGAEVSPVARGAPEPVAARGADLSASRPGRDAAPTGAGAVPGTSSASDQACMSLRWPRQAWIQLPVSDG